MRVAPAGYLFRSAIHIDQRQKGDQPGCRGLQHGHIDALAKAGFHLLGQTHDHIGIKLVAGLQIDQRDARNRRRPVGEAGHFHVADHRLDDRIVARHVGICGPHGRQPGPNIIRLGRAQACIIDAQLFVALGDGVAAEHIHVELSDQALEHGLAFGLFQVKRDRFFSHIGRHIV